jgi:hypothetical protein
VIQPLSLFSEEYTAHGNTAAEGILNQLGRPGLDLLSILVRETVQNSWDARLRDDTTVRCTITGRTLTHAQVDFLRRAVLTEEPEQLKLHEALSAAGKSAHVLVISDRGTTGLNGPIRADAPDDESGSRNFVNFFFNIGQSKGQQLSGGTYGYGKSILYRISQLHTICVYTRCSVGNHLESRFLGAALEPQTETGSGYRRYTGRHWWGRIHGRDSVLEPVTGPDADELAQGLGFLPFAGDETGTCCMVLLPTLGESQLNEVMQRISRLVLWYFWPKMLTNAEGIVPMRFAVYFQEQPVPIPNPGQHPPLRGFVEAMQLLKASQGDHQDSLSRVASISSQRPQRRLGRLALVRFPVQERQDPVSSGSEFTPPIPGISHHVALMRNAELVVKYLEGDQLPISQLEYAGVFIADRDVDSSFAKAEPPTHDDWNTKSMTERQDKSAVNVALRKISEELKEFVTPQTVTGRDEELLPLGDFADLLGSMLIGVEGNAAYVQPVEENLWRKNNRQSAADTPGNGHGSAGSSLSDLPDSNIAGESGGEQNGSSGTTDSGSHTDDGNTTTDAASPASEDPIIRESWDQAAADNGQETVSTASRGRARIELIDEGHLELFKNTPVVLTGFRVKHARNSKSTRVEVETGILLDNGEEEREPPINETGPEVLCWIDSAGKERSGSEAVLIPATDEGTWQVAVSLPDDALLRINLVSREVF